MRGGQRLPLFTAEGFVTSHNLVAMKASDAVALKLCTSISVAGVLAIRDLAFQASWLDEAWLNQLPRLLSDNGQAGRSGHALYAESPKI